MDEIYISWNRRHWSADIGRKADLFYHSTVGKKTFLLVAGNEYKSWLVIVAAYKKRKTVGSLYVPGIQQYKWKRK